MSNYTDELLIILKNAGDEALQYMKTNHRVLHLISPRVMVIQRPEGDHALNLRDVSNVEATIEPGDEVPVEILQDLNETEALSARAWTHRAKPKTRPGEGLSWDAPGFVPPDPPTK
jgi:hypothetical protein